MEALDKAEPKPATKEEKEDHKTKTWRGSPRVWERCTLCDAKKKCSKAGVKRGSKQCIDARYTIARKKG